MSLASVFGREQAEAVAARLGEPAGLRARRLAAWEAWQAAPLPAAADEDWRRCDLTVAGLDEITALTEPNGRRAETAPAPDAAGWLDLDDGGPTDLWLAPELARQGVYLTDLATALQQRPELLERYFMTRAVPADEHAFTHFHAAFYGGGAVLYVPPGVVVEQAILIRHRLHRAGVAAAPHTLLIADRDARVSVVEEFSGGEGKLLSVPVTELVAEASAKITYAAVQIQGREVIEVATRRAWLDRDAEVTLTSTSLGGRLTKSFVGARLAGEGAHCNLYGVYFPEGGQVFDYTTLQDHLVPHCTSDLLFKGALYDRARSVFRGVVRVHPAAQQTDAYQTNNNLLLGDEARADSMPVLEIAADDVRCSHGATLAHLKAEDLFYLRSRGLPHDAAQRMVIAGFFEPVLQHVPLASLRERLQAAVQRRIADH